MYKNLLFIYLFILFSLISCKNSPDKINKNNTDPTKYVIDDKSINNKEIRKQMNAIFSLIEDYISKGNYDAWYNFLSINYKNYINDTDNLKRITSASDYLYNRKIVLNNPKDYFKFVVMQSREGKTLEFSDAEYVNKYHVKVICIFDKTDKFVYDFICEDNSWKLDR